MEDRIADGCPTSITLRTGRGGVDDARLKPAPRTTEPADRHRHSSRCGTKALLVNATFTDAVQKIISTEKWKAIRRKQALGARLI